MTDIFRIFRSLQVGLAALVLVGSAAAFADGRIAADAVRVSTPAYQPRAEDYDPPLGTYTYTASWQGIPAATLEISVERLGDRYRVLTTAKTYRGIDVFYKLRYRAEGLISAIDYTPIHSVMNARENSRVKETEINFLESGEIHSVMRRKGRGDEVLRFNPDNFTLDPFSAAFLARGLDWKLGETKSFDTFNGRSRYLIDLTAIDKTEMRVDGRTRAVWVISPRISKLTDPNGDKKFRGAEIYLTDDRRREIVGIKSRVFIGSVATELIRYDGPPQQLPDPQHFARRLGEHSELADFTKTH